MSLGLTGPGSTPPTYPLYLTAAAVAAPFLLGGRTPDLLPAATGSRVVVWPKGLLPYGLMIGAAWSVTATILALVGADLPRVGLAAWTGVIAFSAVTPAVLLRGVARRTGPVGLFHAAAALEVASFAILWLGLHRASAALLITGALVSGAGPTPLLMSAIWRRRCAASRRRSAGMRARRFCCAPMPGSVRRCCWQGWSRTGSTS